MSRASPSLLQSVQAVAKRSISTGSRISRRTVFQSAASPIRPRTNISSIDPRILEGQSFLPKENVQRISEWQGGLWEKLQGEVQNNPKLAKSKADWDSGKFNIVNLLAESASDPSLALTFNYASLLLNNSFFLERINPGEPQEIPNSMAELEEKVVAYADGIVGSGWLWLVRTGEYSGDVDILPSFGAGTYLVSHRTQRGRDNLSLFAEPPTSSPESSTPSPSVSPMLDESDDQSQSTSTPDYIVPPPLTSRTPSSFGRPTSQKPGQGKSDSSIYPLPIAVLSLFEHAYLGPKYGVWDKKTYARDWWRSLNWNKVNARNEI